MENKKSISTKTVLSIMLIAVLIGCVALCSMGKTASAATTNPTPDADAEPLGLMTKISLEIGTYFESTVYARAKNTFTLGSSTVQVYVYLYTSPTYEEDYKNMTLESENYIGDLNMNKVIETTAQIDGVQRYWRAVCRYKLDKKDWVTKQTSTYLIDVNGNVVR